MRDSKANNSGKIPFSIASLHAALDAEEARATRMAAGDRISEKNQETSRLLSIDDDGLATISVKGRAQPLDVREVVSIEDLS